MSYIAPNAPATLADVIERLKTSRLDATRKRDLVSAVNRVAKMLHRSPDEVPASLPELRRRLLAIHPRTENISARTMANIKAALAKALVITRAASRPLPKVEPNEAWQKFLVSAPAKHNRHGLSRFARYCSMRGLAPADIGDETLRQFESFLDTTLLTKGSSGTLSGHRSKLERHGSPRAAEPSAAHGAEIRPVSCASDRDLSGLSAGRDQALHRSPRPCGPLR